MPLKVENLLANRTRFSMEGKFHPMGEVVGLTNSLGASFDIDYYAWR